MTKAELAAMDEFVVERLYDLWRAGYDPHLIAGDAGLATEDLLDLVRLCAENERRFQQRQQRRRAA